jgi:ketosteroid isomerase-like protein
VKWPEDLLDENVRLHVPGQGPLRGEYIAREDIMALFTRCRAALADKHYEVQLLSYSRGSGHLAVQTKTRAEVDGRPFEWKCTWVCILQHGRVHMLWLFVEEQSAFDQFWTLVLERAAGQTRLA